MAFTTDRIQDNLSTQDITSSFFPDKQLKKQTIILTKKKMAMNSLSLTGLRRQPLDIYQTIRLQLIC